MMFAVGAYSGPRAVCGAVAQLAKNAKHVMAATKRSWVGILGSSNFIRFDVSRRDTDQVERYYHESTLWCKTSGPAVRSFCRNLLVNNPSVGRLHSSSKKMLKNYRISSSNKVKPTGRSGPPHTADRSSLPLPQASAQLVKPE